MDFELAEYIGTAIFLISQGVMNVGIVDNIYRIRWVKSMLWDIEWEQAQKLQ